MISKSCGYAIKIMIYLASQDDTSLKVSLKQIANDTNSPEPFAAKILQQLAKSKLVLSMKGRNGGFSLIERKKITLMEVVSIIDGEKLDQHCVLGFTHCSSNHPCAVHHLFQDTRNKLAQKLRSTYIHSMKNDLDNGSIFLKD